MESKPAPDPHNVTEELFTNRLLHNAAFIYDRLDSLRLIYQVSDFMGNPYEGYETYELSIPKEPKAFCWTKGKEAHPNSPKYFKTQKHALSQPKRPKQNYQKSSNRRL